MTRTQLLLKLRRLHISSHVFDAIVDFSASSAIGNVRDSFFLRHQGISVPIVESKGSSECGNHPDATTSPLSHLISMKAHDPGLNSSNESCSAISYHRSRMHKHLFSPINFFLIPIHYLCFSRVSSSRVSSDSRFAVWYDFKHLPSICRSQYILYLITSTETDYIMCVIICVHQNANMAHRRSGHDSVMLVIPFQKCNMTTCNFLKDHKILYRTLCPHTNFSVLPNVSLASKLNQHPSPGSHPKLRYS